jgi:allantoin racemase
MKICVVNITPVPPEYLSNSKKTVDACCAHVVQPTTQLEFRAPAKGPMSLPQYLEDYRNPWFQHWVVHEVINTVIAADREGFDAIVVNCFDDPGVKEARSLVKTPVFGLSEPTFHYACQLGAKLGALVPDMPGQVQFVQGQIDAMGLASRMIVNGVRAESKRFTESFAEALQNPQAMVDRLAAQSRAMVDDGADVIVLACGGLGQVCGVVGFHSLEYKNAVVPVINPLTTAVKTAEMMVELQRGLGTPIPSQVHIKRLSPADIQRIRAGFGCETQADQLTR